MSILRPWILLLAVLTSPLVAESLRSPVKGTALPDGPPVIIGVDELVQIPLPTTTRFTKALEIEVSIPREAIPFRSSLAVFVYQNFQAGKGNDDPSGDRIGVEVLPASGKFYLEAPLVAKAGLKAAMDTAVLKLPRYDAGFPLAIAILPVDKELPPGYEGFQFSVKTRPLNTNLGALVLTTPSLSDDDRRRLKITANGVIQPSVGPILLEPGPYTVEVALPGVNSVTLTAVVTQAKSTELAVDLTVEDPSLVIEAPEGTQVVIDGKRVGWKPSVAFPIGRGAHGVQFVIGNTVVSDTFTIETGGRHRLTLQMAVNLKQE